MQVKRLKITGDPRDVRRVGAAEPLGTDTVVEAEGVEADLESAHLQCPDGSTRILCRIDGLRKERRTAVASSLQQNRFSQFKHEMS